jgi:HK97 family phage prohead protease
MPSPGISAVEPSIFRKVMPGGQMSGTRRADSVMHTIMPTQMTALGDDEVIVVMSTATVARDGHILIPAGVDLTAYRRNPIILWNHDVEHPIGRAEQIEVGADKITARVRFAPLGVSKKADEIRGLVKAGVVCTVSVGFEPTDGEPLDRTKPRSGMRITAWELLETSFCSVPVDTGAMVTARASRTVGTARAQKKGSSMKSKLAALDTAVDEAKSAKRHHDAVAEHLDRLAGHRTAAASALRAHKAALEAGDTETAIECEGRCQRAVTGMGRELRGITDRHADALDARANLMRAMRAIDNDFDTHDSQTSDGSGAGTSNGDRSRARRQADLRQLSVAPAVVPVSADHARRLRQFEMLELVGKDY